MQQSSVRQQEPPSRRRRRGIAITSGLFLAIIAALLIFGVGFLTGFNNVSSGDPLAAVYGGALAFALLGTPLIAGFIGTLRSGRVSTGTLAGLWEGFLVGVFIGVYIVIVYLTHRLNNAPGMPPQQVQDILAQTGINVSQESIREFTSPNIVLANLVIADVSIALGWLVLGTILGLIGALIGKIFVHHPRDYVEVVAAPNTSTSPPATR